MAVHRTKSETQKVSIGTKQEAQAKVAESSKASEAPNKGWASTPIMRDKPGVLGRLSDGFDKLTGLDKPGPKTITLGPVAPADFDNMEAKVRQLEQRERKLADKELDSLGRGEIVSYLTPRSDGLTEQTTLGVIDMPVDAYLRKVPLEKWGANIADHKGGEVKKVRKNEQIERMVLRAPGKDLDMTKLERLYEDRDSTGKLTGAQVRWEVVKTDNGTVLGDVGVLRLEPFPGDPKRTLVTWHNAVEYGQFPFNVLPEKAGGAILGHMVPDYFKRTIEHQRKTVGVPGE